VKDEQVIKDLKKKEDARLEVFVAKIEGGSGRRIRNFFVSIILFQAFFTGSVFRLESMHQLDGRSADEGIYAYFTTTIMEKEISGIRLLLRNFNANKESWYYPPPYRIGYLVPIALVMKITRVPSLQGGVAVSCFFTIVSLLLMMMFAIRFFNWPIAALALFLAAVSPLDIALAQRFWQDAMMGCLGMLLLYLSCRIIKDFRKTIWMVLFIVAGAYGLLIKESAVIIYGLCLLYVLGFLIFREKEFKRAGLLVIFSILGMAISAGILFWVVGGAPIVWEAISHIRGIMDGSPYGVRTCSGPWFQIIKGFWLLMPCSMVLCALAIVVALFNKIKPKVLFFHKNQDIVFFMIFILTAYIGIITYMPNLKNMRYMGVVSGPFYLLSACGVWEVILFLRAKLRNCFFYLAMIFLVLCLIVFALIEYQRFWDLVVKSRLNDLAIISMDRVYHGFPPPV
jgi:hypothetical protein